MPFQIETRTLTRLEAHGELKVKDALVCTYAVPYVCLNMMGHALIDSDCPGEGIALTPTESCPIIIFQCPELNRTITSLWDYETHPAALLKSLCWVSKFGEPGVQATKRLILGDDNSEPLSVDVCVLLPRNKDNDAELAEYHCQWIANFLKDFHLFMALRSPASSFTQRDCLLPNSHVLVDKTPSQITILEPAPPTKNESKLITQLIQMPCIPTIHSPAERLMINLLLQYNRASPGYPTGPHQLGVGRNDLLFDGTVHVHPPGTGCKSRLFLRSARLNEPQSARIELTKLDKNRLGNWIEHSTTSKNGVQLLDAFEAASLYPVCEKCPLKWQ